MKTLSDLEQEKQELLKELEILKKQIQRDISAVEKKYTSQDIAKNLKKEISKQYLNKQNIAILGASAGVMLLFYVLFKKRKRKKMNTIPNNKKDKKNDLKPSYTSNKSSFVSELAKEIIWTVALEVIRKKVNEYIKKKSAT